MAAASRVSRAFHADGPTSLDLVGGELWPSTPDSHTKKMLVFRASRTGMSDSSPSKHASKDSPQTSAQEVGIKDGTPKNSKQASLRRPRSDEPLTFGQRKFPRLSKIVLSREFEIFIGVVIVVNCVIMGFEAEMMLGKAEDFKTIVEVTENLITFIFVLEVILRALVNGWRSYVPFVGSVWNFLDAMLVLVTGVVVVWIMPLFDAASDGTLQTLTVLRALRLMRLVRVVANFELFHEVWLLLRGLMESGRVLFWTVIVIFFITYVFAIFGVALLSVNLKDEYDATLSATRDLEVLVEVTGGVFPFMYTLIQVLTLDSWNGIARPMMDHVGWSWAFFYSYIVVAVIVMMNLVTAVIVDNALQNSQKDATELLLLREKQRQSKLAHFRQVFERLDADGNGQLSWPEFESAFEDEELAMDLKLLGIESDSCREIFDLLDTGDGVLSVQEFFDGLAHMDGGARAKDLLRVNRQLDLVVKLICQQTQEFREDLDELLYLTPGARVRDRKGTFKARAFHRAQSGVDHSRHSGTSDSLSASKTSTRSIGWKPALDSPREEQVSSLLFAKGRAALDSPRDSPSSLGDVVSRLEQVVFESKQEIKGSFDACLMMVDSCNQNMFTLIKDMSDIRESLTPENVIGVDIGLEHKRNNPCETPLKSKWFQEFAKPVRLSPVPSLQPDQDAENDSPQQG